MKKTLSFVLVSAALCGAGIVSAQTYYPAPTASCVSLTRDLSIGMRGSDVSSLQSFLVAQNYPGSGAWMVTGYFGAATQAALRIYQQTHGLVPTGVADAATRASIAACASGAGAGTGYYGFPYAYQYPYAYNYTYPATGQVKIDTLSVSSAVTGASVTIGGSGFDYNNNTVYVGNVPVVNVPSASGTSLTFVVPPNVGGLVQVYVANSRGASNSLPLTVLNFSGGSGCVFPFLSGYGNCCGFGQCQNAALSITSLSPDHGAVGTQVTVYGTGFSTSGNTVRFGTGIIANVGSIDGKALSFTVPATLIGYNTIPVGLGTYPVSVTNASGFTSNALPFTVTSLGAAQAPTISNVSGPSSLAVGVAGTWTITVATGQSTYTSVSVSWGDEGVYAASVASPQITYTPGTQTFTFTHTYLQPGTYTVKFTATNLAGKSATATATVVVGGGGSGTVSLTSIAPASGKVGSLVTLTGSGFTTFGNTVHFGVGGMRNLYSPDGTHLYFTVPAFLSPCDVAPPGTYCALYAQQVTPGAYQVYVENSLGQSAQQTFTVLP